MEFVYLGGFAWSVIVIACGGTLATMGPSFRRPGQHRRRLAAFALTSGLTAGTLATVAQLTLPDELTMAICTANNGLHAAVAFPAVMMRP